MPKDVFLKYVRINNKSCISSGPKVVLSQKRVKSSCCEEKPTSLLKIAPRILSNLRNSITNMLSLLLSESLKGVECNDDDDGTIDRCSLS